MERWRVVIPIVLALLVAGIASVLLYNWMQKQKVPKKVAEVKEIKTVNVAVALAPLHPGTVITSEMIKTKTIIKTATFLEESLPPGYFKDLNKLKGRVVFTPIKNKELILESKLAPKSIKRGGLSAILNPGKRAVTIAGNNVLGISGLVNPGDRVDILMMTQDPKSGKQVNKTVFENVRVIAAGSQLRRNPEGKPSPTGSYTLEVTPEQGERLTLAAKQGKLQFSLRSARDWNTVLTTGATKPEILAAYRPVDPSKRIKPKKIYKGYARPIGARRAPSVSKGFTLEVIKGLNRKIQKF